MVSSITVVILADAGVRDRLFQRRHLSGRAPWPGTAKYIIEIEGLWTKFGDFVVHRGVDLKVPTGEILALVGGSGSGKTTLLRQMLGLETPHQGSVSIFGQRLDSSDRNALQALRNRWGVLFQEGALYSALPVFGQHRAAPA